MNSYWVIPELWRGATCYILAGGPSLHEVDFKKLHDKRVIAVNDAYRLHQWDCMYFKDECWFNRPASLHTHKTNEERLLNFIGLKVTNCESLLGKTGIKVCARGQYTGLELNPYKLNNGASAGQEALCLALRFGVAKIILLGYDMRMVGERHNWHADHTRTVPSSIYEDQFIPRFKELNSISLKMGVDIINCTPNSALKEFPFGRLEDHLD